MFGSHISSGIQEILQSQESEKISRYFANFNDCSFSHEAKEAPLRINCIPIEKPRNTFKVLLAFLDHVVRCILFTHIKNSYIDFTFFLPLFSYDFHCKESLIHSVLVLYIILKYLPIIRKSSIKYEYCSVLFILHLSLLVYIHMKNRKEE